MLSRLAISRGVTPFLLARQIATSNVAFMPIKEGPERDLVNFPRPKRLERNPPVKLGLIPEDWFKFFYPKTGVTGPWMFGGGLVTYLISKEIWVLEHEFYNGVSLVILIVLISKKLGPSISAYLEKEQDAELAQMYEGKNQEIKQVQDSIANEKKTQWQMEGGDMIFDVKKENIALQVEATYRERIMTVFSEVKKRLDYQVDKQNIERNILQKNMVAWIVQRVQGAITPESEQENLKKCIADLKGLAAKA